MKHGGEVVWFVGCFAAAGSDQLAIIVRNTCNKWLKRDGILKCISPDPPPPNNIINFIY